MILPRCGGGVVGAGRGCSPLVPAGERRSVVRVGHDEIERLAVGVDFAYVHPFAEDSPSDFVWGAREKGGGYDGQTLLGLALMRARDELIADVRTRLTALAPGR